jgi:hypothetical protein
MLFESSPSITILFRPLPDASEQVGHFIVPGHVSLGILQPLTLGPTSKAVLKATVFED